MHWVSQLLVAICRAICVISTYGPFTHVTWGGWSGREGQGRWVSKVPSERGASPRPCRSLTPLPDGAVLRGQLWKRYPLAPPPHCHTNTQTATLRPHSPSSRFTGTAGTAVVLQDKALLWTDGRYFLQVVLRGAHVPCTLCVSLRR